MPIKKKRQKYTRDPQEARTTLLYVLTLIVGCSLVVFWQGRWVANNQDIFKLDPVKKFSTGPNGSKLVVCSHCNYHGRVDVGGAEYMCPICYGVGGRYVKRVDTGEQFCLYCDGMGRLLDGKGISSQVCPICQGRGAKRVAYGQAMCPECEGMGTIFNRETDTDNPCSLCSGSGEIFEDVPFTMQEAEKEKQ